MKEVIPSKDQYALQGHAISRAAHDCPVLLKRLIFLAMAQVRPEDKGFMEMSMKVGDIARAISDREDTGKPRGVLYERIRKLSLDGLKRVVVIPEPDGSWVAHQWFSRLRYDKPNDTMTIRLHDDLRHYVSQVKGWASFSLQDVGRIQGRHALRWFELVKSREGQADKKGFWFYDVKFDELRFAFKIGANEYPLTSKFRIKVIDEPIRELNAADLGFQLEADYTPFRRGRELVGVRMKCYKVNRGERLATKPKRGRPTREEEEAYRDLPPARQKRVDAIMKDLRMNIELPMEGLPAMKARAEAMAIEKKEYLTSRARKRRANKS